MLCVIEPEEKLKIFLFDETSISHYFNDNKLSGYSIKEVEQTELIIINQKSISQIKEHYRLIQNSYIGHYKELNDKIVNLEKEILIEQNQHEITKKNHELTQKIIINISCDI